MNQSDQRPQRDSFEFQNLRDLYWTVTSPALITLTDEDFVAPDELDLAQVNAEELSEFLMPYSRFRVGE
ncbi:MAG: hypothetical protein KDA74_13970, partial [Planctomycetaceae bacterium]|nr:hypothetical protein [Planctomycetaceae bacterium]